MPPVRQHRIGDQLPSLIHPDPDPAAIDLCRELADETDVEAVILFGSRAAGGRDEQSDLDTIIIHDGADDDDRRKALGRALADLKECHYPGHADYDIPANAAAALRRRSRLGSGRSMIWPWWQSSPMQGLGGVRRRH